MKSGGLTHRDWGSVCTWGAQLPPHPLLAVHGESVLCSFAALQDQCTQTTFHSALDRDALAHF